MKIRAKIQKWGNGLALRVGGLMREIPHLEEGSEVEVEIFDYGFSVRKTVLNKLEIMPYSEAQLLEEINPDLAHADLLAKPLSSEFE